MSLFRREPKDVPQLNTASLPDLIFSVLFFFMIVTHMRTDDVHVRYTLPQGKSLTQLKQKAALCSIFIGKAPEATKQGGDAPYIVEINGKAVSMEQISAVVSKQRKELSADNRPLFTVLIKADADTPMQLIARVKQALQAANAGNVFYVATEQKHG